MRYEIRNLPGSVSDRQTIAHDKTNEANISGRVVLPASLLVEKLDPKSPYYNVDELGSPPVSRGGGPSGVEKKKLKEAGERIEKWFRKKEGKGPVRVQEKLPGMRQGGLIRGFPKIAKKGWR